MVVIGDFCASAGYAVNKKNNFCCVSAHLE